MTRTTKEQLIEFAGDEPEERSHVAQGVLPKHILPVILWLEGGCNPQEAAKELRLLCADIKVTS